MWLFFAGSHTLGEGRALTNLIPSFCCAMVLCRHHGRFLMIQEAKSECRGQWSYPGGRIEPGEALDLGIKREVEEEASIIVRPHSILLVEHGRLHVDGAWKERWRFVIEADYVSGTPKDFEDHESIQAAWISPEEVQELALREEVSPTYIRDFEKYGRLPIEQYVYFTKKY